MATRTRIHLAPALAVVVALSALAATACASNAVTATRDRGDSRFLATTSIPPPASPSTKPASTSPNALGCPARLVLTGADTVVLPVAPAGTQAGAHPAHGAVPGGARAARVCRYSTMDDGPAGSVETRPNQLAQQGQAPNRTVVDRLVDLLDAGGTWGPGTYSCPADFGGHDLVILTYRDASQLEVLIDPTGCATVSTATSADYQVTADLSAELIALAGRWAPSLPD